jgi:hypothetical protein
MNSEKEQLTIVNFTREEIFGLLNLLSNDDCPFPIWGDITNKIRMSKDKEIDAVEKNKI